MRAWQGHPQGWGQVQPFVCQFPPQTTKGSQAWGRDRAEMGQWDPQRLSFPTASNLLGGPAFAPFFHPKYMAGELAASRSPYSRDTGNATSQPLPSHPVPPRWGPSLGPSPWGYMEIKIIVFNKSIKILCENTAWEELGVHSCPPGTGDSPGRGRGPPWRDHSSPHLGDFWGARRKPSSGDAFTPPQGWSRGAPEHHSHPAPKGTSPTGGHTGCGDTSCQPWAVTHNTTVAHHCSLARPLLQQVPRDTHSPPEPPTPVCRQDWRQRMVALWPRLWGGTVGNALPSHRTLSHCHKATRSLKPPCPQQAGSDAAPGSAPHQGEP